MDQLWGMGKTEVGHGVFQLSWMKDSVCLLLRLKTENGPDWAKNTSLGKFLHLHLGIL